MLSSISYFFLIHPATSKVIPLHHQQKPQRTDKWPAILDCMTILRLVKYSSELKRIVPIEERIEIEYELIRNSAVRWLIIRLWIFERALLCETTKNALPEGFYLLMTFRMTFKVSEKPSFYAYSSRLERRRTCRVWRTVERANDNIHSVRFTSPSPNSLHFPIDIDIMLLIINL